MAGHSVDYQVRSHADYRTHHDRVESGRGSEDEQRAEAYKRRTPCLPRVQVDIKAGSKSAQQVAHIDPGRETAPVDADQAGEGVAERIAQTTEDVA